MEGNELVALPVGCLQLRRLARLTVRNNYLHPLFWLENSRNQPQVRQNKTTHEDTSRAHTP